MTLNDGKHIRLLLPDNMAGTPFWPWRKDTVPEVLYFCRGGDYYPEVWEVFKTADRFTQR